MSDAVSRLFARISLEAAHAFALRVELTTPERDILDPRARTRAFVDLVSNAPDGVRMKVEGIAGRIIAFADKIDIAEAALRSVCWDNSALRSRIDEDVSLEERSLALYLAEPKLFDRAANVAAGIRWRGGRQHAGFSIPGGGALSENLARVAEAIRQAVQTTLGGRRVDYDVFTLPEMHGLEVAADATAATPIHHIAVYVEAPASYLIEFAEDRPGAAPVLRSEAREISIDYSPATGVLDVAGRGVGGSRTLLKVAELFATQGVGTDSYTQIEKHEFSLNALLFTSTPQIVPPAGFSSATVEEIVIRSRSNRASLASFKGGEGRNAFERMRELGLKDFMLASELVRSITFRFETIASREEDRRLVRATLNWPSTLTFDSATPADRKRIEAWAYGLKANVIKSSIIRHSNSPLIAWINASAVHPEPMLLGAIGGDSPDIVSHAIKNGLFRQIGVAETVQCSLCETEHRASVRRNGGAFEVYCPFHDWQPVAESDVTEFTIDRTRVIALLAKAAGGAPGRAVADGRLQVLGELNRPSGQGLWTLAYADDLENPKTLEDVRRFLGSFEEGGIVVTPSYIPLQSPLPKSFRFASIDDIFSVVDDGFMLKPDRAWEFLKPLDASSVTIGRPTLISLEKRLFLQLRSTADWPPTATDQARRILASWPGDWPAPSKQATIAGHISRHAVEWIAAENEVG